MRIETKYLRAYQHFVKYFKYSSSMWAYLVNITITSITWYINKDCNQKSPNRPSLNDDEFEDVLQGLINKYQTPECDRTSIDFVTWFIAAHLKYYQDQWVFFFNNLLGQLKWYYSWCSIFRFTTRSQQLLFVLDCIMEMFDIKRKYSKSFLKIYKIDAKTRWVVFGSLHHSK